MVSTRVLMFTFVYIQYQVYVLFGYMYVRAPFTTVYVYVFDYSGIGTYYESLMQQYIYMYILCTMISAALLSCSVSSTNEYPHIK